VDEVKFLYRGMEGKEKKYITLRGWRNGEILGLYWNKIKNFQFSIEINLLLLFKDKTKIIIIYCHRNHSVPTGIDLIYFSYLPYPSL